MSRARTWLVAAALAALPALACGCRPDVKDLCETLDEDCIGFPYADCLADGKRLEQAVTSKCSDLWDEYLSCIDDATCSWKAQCESKRKALESCTGPFPQ